MWGYVAGVLFLISGLPQTIKLLKRKRSDDISVWMYLITAVGIGMILLEAEGSVFWGNLASLAILSVNIGLIIYYRKNHGN